MAKIPQEGTEADCCYPSLKLTAANLNPIHPEFPPLAPQSLSRQSEPEGVLNSKPLIHPKPSCKHVCVKAPPFSYHALPTRVPTEFCKEEKGRKKKTAVNS